MIKFFKEFSAQDLSGYTLLLPAVSVGNVGQLTTDLIIANLGNCKKIGRVFHDALESVVGYDNGSDAGPLMTSCEIYQSTNNQLIILQFHAPVLVKQTKDFVDFIVSWIQETNFKQVICLSSTFASERNDAQLVGPPFRYLATSATSSVSVDLIAGQVKRLESRQFPAPPIISGDDKTPNNNGEIYIPGGGITKDLLDACESKEIPLVVFIMFVSEGDNTPDARLYFYRTNQLYQWSNVTEESHIKIPQSWVQLFGATFPPEIY